jgi:exopolysaccharide production protein ExoQ
MAPLVALLVWLVLLLALLHYDPARSKRSHVALWVPMVWMFIIGTRLPSQWLGGQIGLTATALEEGNPIDRAISSGLILLTILILTARSFKWEVFLSRNVALTAFLCCALLSVFWSDYPLVTFKHWFRDLGNYLVILIPLSDPRPFEAVGTLLRRLFYLLIPLSVLLVKYFPAIGRQYNEWTGVAMYTGPTTGKNMLGVLCLTSGLFFFWDTVTRWSNRRERRTKRIILINVAFISMTLWLLNIADSATSRVCLVIGWLVIAMAHTKAAKRNPTILTWLVPVGICLYMTLAFGFGLDINAQLARALGRDPTLTDRTKMWSFLLSMKISPLVGTGYETFWLGPRLQWFWQNAGLGHINEAHNGFLEVYLNLGIIGLSLLGWLLIASYRTICRRFKSFSSFGSLGLALWTTLLLYSVTEVGFRSGLIWLTFLLGAIAIPERTSAVTPGHATPRNPHVLRHKAWEETTTVEG